MGYSPNGYRLWDKEKRRITITRDVEFEETRQEDLKNQEQEERKWPKLQIKEDIQEEESEDENNEEVNLNQQ